MINPIRLKIRSLSLVLAGAWLALFSGTFAGTYAQKPAGYQNYNALTTSLNEMVKSNKQLVKLESIAKTSEGRDVWLLTIGNPQGVPLNERPGLLIGANFEGDHLVGSVLAMEVANYLLKESATNEAVKNSLAQYVYYIFPRINPDAAELMFGKLKAGRRTNNSPFDDDNDGRMDEDGPEDLNGDGAITVMRVKDTNGDYMIDPENTKLMKRADPTKGEAGAYSIYWEGTDNDVDGFINEDPAGGTDINRNFQHAYPYYKSDAGKHMISEVETRGLMDWVLTHKNVSMILTFGESDNLINPPSSRGQIASDRGLDMFAFADASTAGASKVGMMSAGGGRGFGRFGGFGGGGGGRRGQAEEASTGRTQRPVSQPATTINTADLTYFNKISEKYKELTGIKTQPVLRNPEGAFFQFGYFQFGVLSFSTPGWGLLLPEDTARRGGNMRRPSGIEAPAAQAGGNAPAAARGAGRGAGGFSGMTGGASPGGAGEGAGSSAAGIDAQFLKFLEFKNPAGFKDWAPFKHPEFGEVEIGGFALQEINNPPYEILDQLGEAHGEFAVWMTSLNAKVKVASTNVENLGGGLFRIKAEVENTGFLPTAIRHGVSSRAVGPTMVQLGVDPENIVIGNDKTNFFQALEGSGKRQKYEWMIKGKAGDTISLKVVSQKAGSETITIKLK